MIQIPVAKINIHTIIKDKGPEIQVVYLNQLKQI